MHILTPDQEMSDLSRLRGRFAFGEIFGGDSSDQSTLAGASFFCLREFLAGHRSIPIKSAAARHFTGGDQMESEFDGQSYPAVNDSMYFASGRVGNIDQGWSGIFETGFPATLVWIVATSVIVGFFIAMLVVGIAITV